MQPAARERILATVPHDALVLDVGGWAVPFPRADWMLDLMPYETRGQFGYEGDPADERFSADTWVTRDICDREPWPFADKQFDFVICSHTLEDVRDPIWVCGELARVAKAGYIEVPSRAWEQQWRLQNDFAGFSHHHWLVDVDQERSHLTFTFKYHALHADREAMHAGPVAPEDTFQALWWDGNFTVSEQIFFVPLELHTYLRAGLGDRPSLAAERSGRGRRLRFWHGR